MRDSGSPVATLVNRDERISAVRPASRLSLPGRRRLPHLFLVVWLRDSATDHHQDQGRHGVLACPWLHWQPQKTGCSPSRPIVASKRARTDLWFRHVSFPGDQPLVAHDTGATSPCSGGAGGGVQSGLLVMPAHLASTATTAPLLLIERSRHVEGLTALHDVVARPRQLVGPPP